MAPNNVVASIGTLANSPPVVVVSSLAALGAKPVLERLMDADQGGLLSNMTTIKLLNLALYFLCIYSTQQPGRIAGSAGTASRYQDNDSALKKSGEKQQDQAVEEMMTERRKSLFVPSGWAFAIWGVIFLGELIFVTSSALLINENSAIAPLYKNVSVGFLAAQLCQTMWTRTFRPIIFKGNGIYLSSFLLSGIAYGLNDAHAQFSLFSSELKSWYQYLLYFFPMSLHFGWTTAASLVNWNGNIAFVSSSSCPRLVTLAGHASTLVATGLGVGLTLTRRAPVFGCVIAWALTACATEMGNRLQLSSRQQPESQPALSFPFKQKSPAPRRQVAGNVGVRLQRWLCGLGAALSFAASIYVVMTVPE